MSLAELTVDLDEAYYGGGTGGAAGPIPPDMVAINGRVYLLDTASGEYRREGIEVLQQRNTNNNRDLLLLPQDIWRQQMESWHQGAGQPSLDREEALPYRYSRSYGIDPWERYQISLLNTTTKLFTLATADPCFLQVHNDYLVAAVGTALHWFHNGTGAPTSITVGSSKIISCAYDGDDVITLHDDGQVWKTRNPTTTAQYMYNPPGSPAVPNAITAASFVAYVKDYLILGVGNQLWDITPITAVTPTASKLVYTSPTTGFTWKGAAEGNAAIYLIGGSGERSVVHRVQVSDDGTRLDPAVVAASLPDGEDGTSIGGYLGYVFIGTAKGVRMSIQSTASGDLVLGALLPTEAAVYGFEGQDRFVWATASIVSPISDAGGMSADPEFPTVPVCGLFRADLSTFTTSESTPAYATDIVAADQTGKVVQSVVTIKGVRAFSVNNGGVYVETDTKMKGGWLDQGRISFSVEDLKTSLYAQAKWEPLRGRVAIDLSYDSAPPTRVLNWSIPDSIRSGNIPLNGQQFSRVDVRYVLYRDAIETKKGPVFTRFEFRARAVKGAASRWYLPIINHEELDLNGIPEARDVTNEFAALMKLVESGIMFPLQEGGRVYHVVAKDFKWLPQKLNMQGNGWQGVYTLIVEEAR
jgi:hypothetical protein